MKKFVLSLLLLLVFGAVLAGVILTGKKLFRTPEAGAALDFLPPGRSFFVSVRGAKDFGAEFEVIRSQKIPFIGSLNKYLFSLEYVMKHRFTAGDVAELAGEDFVVQFSPRFLFVTKTRREYNVFFYLDIKNDTDVSRSGLLLRSKRIGPLGLDLFYLFHGEWLIVSDDPAYLVSVLRNRGRRRFPAGPETVARSRFLLGWSGLRQSSMGELSKIQNVFYGMKTALVCGPALASLRLYPRNEELADSASATSGLMFCRYDLRHEAGTSGTLKGAVCLAGLTLAGDGMLSPDLAYAIPVGLSPRSLRRVTASLRNADGRQDLFLAQELSSGHHILFGGEALPVLDGKGSVFFLDGPAIARTRVFGPAMNDLLIRLGKVEVRP